MLAAPIVPTCSMSDPSGTACATIGVVEISTPAKNNPITRTFGSCDRTGFGAQSITIQ